jgi:hypothetical protein
VGKLMRQMFFWVNGKLYFVFGGKVTRVPLPKPPPPDAGLGAGGG